MEIPDHFTCLLRDKKHQLELNMEQQTCSKLGEEYVKAIYYHSAYLTYLATSCEMPGLSEQCKEIEENNRLGKTRDLFKKLDISREYFMQGWT